MTLGSPSLTGCRHQWAEVAAYPIRLEGMNSTPSSAQATIYERWRHPSAGPPLAGEGQIVVDGVVVSLLNTTGIDAPDDQAWEALAARATADLFDAGSAVRYNAGGTVWLVSVPEETPLRLRAAVGRDLAAAIRATGQAVPVTPDEEGSGLLGGGEAPGPLPALAWDPRRQPLPPIQE